MEMTWFGGPGDIGGYVVALAALAAFVLACWLWRKRQEKNRGHFE